jgi:hypothetical protein
MRASHFANFVVDLTTFVATYQLFNGEEQLPTLPANQLENIQASVLTKKSDRLALKEEDQGVTLYTRRKSREAGAASCAETDDGT